MNSLRQPYNHSSDRRSRSGGWTVYLCQKPKYDPAPLFVGIAFVDKHVVGDAADDSLVDSRLFSWGILVSCLASPGTPSILSIANNGRFSSAPYGN